METLLRLKVKSSGFKHKHLAEKIGVSPNYFYMCVKGLRELSKDKQTKLKELLS
jgi:plasmid maintenance system antidote protein VapI